MVSFASYRPEDYQRVCDFLIELNRKDKVRINWNWARWEWMYFHPEFDRSCLPAIGLWKNAGKVVGAAIYDMYYGEAFCGALEGYEALLPQILAYARKALADGQGLGVSVNDADEETASLLRELGYRRAEQSETILRISLRQALGYTLPEGFSIRETRFPEDMLAYKTVIWKGFDHEGDQAELRKMLQSDAIPPHLRSSLCLSVQGPDGNFAAHCTCWYDGRTDYAYIEPVCTVPQYRGRGLGKAVVRAALQQCASLGAKEAVVISDQTFYKKIGFEEAQHFTFYWISPESGALS